MKRLLSISFVLVTLLGLLTSCFAGQGEPTLDANMIQTFAAQTISARQTISVLETRIALLTQMPTQPPVIITATLPPAAATSTPLPGPTRTVAPSSTPLPTATPIPTLTLGPACNVAHFVKDVTILDGSVVAPQAAFTKTWRLRNDGSCTWTTGYAIIFTKGDAMSAPAEVKLTKAVAPGETGDLSVDLVAPTNAGTYQGYFHLRSAAGASFGTGDNDVDFFVKIKVAIPTLTSLKLTENYCNAAWKALGGAVPCPSSKYDFTNGSVVVVANPKLSGGSVDDEPALVTVPNNGAGGQIVGRYPSVKIKSGDHLKTLTGCMFGYPDCSVTFSLFYSVDGGSDVSLGSWDLTYTTALKPVDIDLSSLADKNVQLVFLVRNKNGNSKDDAAFWLNPHIVRP